MSWVNLDDVYVNKTGDSIAGNLSVGGTLTINNAKGNGGTYNVANEITTLRDSVSRVLATPKIKLNGTVNIPGLKNRAAVTVAFGFGAYGVMPTSDGTHNVAGAVGQSNFVVMTACATASISGDQVTFRNILFNKFETSGLGNALILSAGDAETIEAIYG